MTATDARLDGFRHLPPAQRLDALANARGLDAVQQRALGGAGALGLDTADGMIENVIGRFELPLGIATDFVVNGRAYQVPMAVEEPSVVAAASFMAKLARACGGFTAESDPPVMRGQIQLLGIDDLGTATRAVEAAADDIIELANTHDRALVALGGGCCGVECHAFAETAVGPMLVVHLLVDVRDAMGANTVNSKAELVAPLLERVTGGTARLRILSNLADKRLVRAHVRLTPDTLSTREFEGAAVVSGIVEAGAFADVDPYRAATHNKGIMNGIDPVVLATGNDWRAIEAGAHAWAARGGRYTALTRWRTDDDGALLGSIELPLALGLVGGATRTHPAAQAALAVLGVSSANDLAEVVASVGLAQNLAALRALSTEGIQRGHMALHARNIAIAAGARGEAVAWVAAEMIAAGEVSVDAARQHLAAIDR
ncbi:MAG: hydroxymethylglutaryl-CoA reductase, degradative [Pseudomonadota bacterium]